MNHRLLALSIAAVCLAPVSVVGQAAKGWKPARTADGQPDLQGVWTNSTLTPLERPREFAGKPSLTEAEASAYEKQTLVQGNRDRRDGGAEADVGRAYNELFFDRGTQLARISNSIRTSMVVDPPDGKIPPMTPEAEKRQERARNEARLHPADGPKDRGLAERCVFWGTTGPPMLPGPYNNLYQIYQAPGYVMILSEMIHESRVIPLDGRPHLSSNIRNWVGDPRGHWEGNTLVVDTTNFSDRTRFRGSTENLHIVERFTRVDPDTIVYKFTVEDPATWTRSWTAELPLTKAQGPIYEYACHEGNYALVDILKGARAEEKR